MADTEQNITHMVIHTGYDGPVDLPGGVPGSAGEKATVAGGVAAPGGASEAEAARFRRITHRVSAGAEQAAARRGSRGRRSFARAMVWCASLTAVFTAVALIAALRYGGLLVFSDTVRLDGDNNLSSASVRKIQQVWDALSGDFYLPPDENLMLEYAAAGMAGSVGDVYTAYYPVEEMRQFTEHSAGTFHGIGVYVVANGDGSLVITGFLENSPALEAGVMAGDVVISVDGTGVEEIGDGEQVIAMIKGPVGTKVRLGLHRPSDGADVELYVERREIKAENIFSRVIQTGAAATADAADTTDAADATDAAGTGTPVGYIRLDMFDGSAAEYFKRHLDGLLAEGISALIIDLRNNPGGDFDQTVKIADSLIGEAVIVYTEDRAGNRVFRRSDASALGLPIRVLINGQSASASEILAGAIKDNGAGRLVGTKSFGKGLVQAVMTLADGSGLKYTRSRYFTPSGVCIQGTGIEPDLAVELPAPYGGYAVPRIPEGEDSQLDAAIADCGLEPAQSSGQ